MNRREQVPAMRLLCALALVSCAASQPPPPLAPAQPPPPVAAAQPPPPPAPPAEGRWFCIPKVGSPMRLVGGEGPCKEDADCSVQNGRTCCTCETIEVTSRLHKRARPPECGCGDMGRMQRMPSPDGEEDETRLGPCGRRPPAAGEYRAVCRN